MWTGDEGQDGAGVARDDLSFRDEQRLVYALAVAVLPLWVIDVCVAWPRVPWDTLAVRAGWSAVSALTAWAQGRVGRRPRLLMRLGVGVVAPNFFFAWVVLRLGGAHSPLFAWFCAMPLLMTVVTEGDVRVALMSAGASLGATASVLGLEAEPLPPVRTAAWVLVVMTSGLVGVLCTLFFGRLLRGRDQAEARRLAAQDALVDSQARALQAERLAQVGRLAAGVAHEVNNPLAYIQANLRFLQEEWASSPGAGAASGPGAAASRPGAAAEHGQALRDTLAGVDRIQRIVQDLTALAHNTERPGVVEPCALAPVIEESVRLASVRLRTVGMVVEVPAEAPPVLADSRRLGQVLLNLLLNAADALEEAAVARPSVVLRVVEVPGGVRLLVEDNGRGIAQENLARLFIPFFTTKAPGKGTGLGLALSRQYVEGFGGRLSAENLSGGGARFIVELRSACSRGPMRGSGEPH